MPGDDASEPVWRVQHDQHKEDTLIEEPRAGRIGYEEREQSQSGGSKGGPEEQHRPADETLKHDLSRDMGRKQRVVGRLVHNRKKPARDPGESRGDRKYDDLGPVRVVA